MKFEVKNITKKYKEKTVVNNFSMVINENECVGLIGPNGAGKSTLIQIIVDILHADEGEVLLNDKKISNMKREIGYLPQYPNFFHWMTAFETLRFMGELSGLSKAQLKKEIPILLEKVGLARDVHSNVGTFSGGMKQRLGIAQALLHKPSFILMDEPVSALDPIGRREVLNLLQEIKKEATILLSTHILSDAEEICERFVIIKNGVKIEDKTRAQLLSRHKENTIYLTVDVIDHRWLQNLENQPYVQKVVKVGLKVKVNVDNMEEDKRKLLHFILKQDVNVNSFEVGEKETLEEIFMKLVVDV
ncbi:ABC transporter ATP-binding protein [Ureibacillus composti]|nr:ABC transporter ATP-binding protein [Ureibacillus composti]